MLKHYKINKSEFCVTRFVEPGWHIFFNQPRVQYGAQFFDWLSRVLCGRILRGRNQGTRLWNCLDFKWLCRVLPDGADVTIWYRTWWNRSWHSHFKSALFCIHSSAHSSCAWISCHFANLELQRCFLLLPIGIKRAGPNVSNSSWVPSLFSDPLRTGRRRRGIQG